MTLPAIALAYPAAIQHEVSFNELANAFSAGALYGVKKSQTQGLKLTLYGGNFPTAGGPVHVNDQSVVLTASATNYISANTSGVVVAATATPTGWPGPMTSGARALYQLTVGTDAITSGTCYRMGTGAPGPTGAKGATGLTGRDWHGERRRLTEYIGDNNNGETAFGFAGMNGFSGSLFGWNLNASSDIDWIEQTSIKNNTTAANSSSGMCSANNFCTRGNAAGRGGFDVRMRWEHNAVQQADMRFFAGLYNVGAGAPGASVEPSTLLNMIGVGIDSGDSGNDLRLMSNDGSGTATKTTLTGFGARKNDVTGYWPVYDLRLWCDANASSINYWLHNQYNKTETSGVITTDLPANTAFLGFLLYTNTGPTGGAVCFPNPMQFFAATRY